MNFFRTHLPSILSLFLLGICFFLSFSSLYSQSSLVIANVLNTISYYKWKDHSIERYNEAIFLAKEGDFSGATALLGPLLNDTEFQNKSELYELYADLTYSLGKEVAVPIFYYRESLVYDKTNLRVEKKLSLLEESEKKWSLWQSWSTLTATWQEDAIREKQEKLQELQKTSEERWNALNYESANTKEDANMIRSTLNLLEWGKEQRDW